MTLVISCLTDDYVVQVSDRRFTDDRTGRFIEESNKAVVFGNRMTFAYTGLGRIEGRRTDLWLADRLMEQRVSLPAAVNAVGGAAARAFSQPSMQRWGHGVRWSRLGR